MIKYIALFLLAIVITSCTLSQPDQSVSEENDIACPEVRAKICTMDYRPVCATRDTDVRCITTPCPSSEHKTYSNACEACADEKVSGYVKDECPIKSLAN